MPLCGPTHQCVPQLAAATPDKGTAAQMRHRPHIARCGHVASVRRCRLMRACNTNVHAIGSHSVTSKQCQAQMARRLITPKPRMSMHSFTVRWSGTASSRGMTSIKATYRNVPVQEQMHHQTLAGPGPLTSSNSMPSGHGKVQQQHVQHRNGACCACTSHAIQ